MARHKLVQTWNAVTAPMVFNLAAGDDVDTDIMSECVSVVVLYGAVGAAPARFANAVGQHGGGGIGNVNMTDLINAVPLANRAGAQVFIVTGHTAVNESYTSINNTAIRAAKATLQGAGFRIIRIHSGWSGAYISDTGDCQKYI